MGRARIASKAALSKPREAFDGPKKNPAEAGF
jgi:hypothetical protein